MPGESRSSAKHTSLEKAGSVYDRVKNRVTVFGTNSSIAAEEAEPIASRTATLGGLLDQGQTHTWTIPVDAGVPAYFTLSYGVGVLDMVVVSPSGQRFDPGNTIQHEKAEVAGGFLEVYNFDAPEVGEWTVQVTGTSAAGLSGRPSQTSFCMSLRRGWTPPPSPSAAAPVRAACTRSEIFLRSI